MAIKTRGQESIRKDKHHLYEPECDYKPSSKDDIEGLIAQQFREHPANIVEINMDAHRLYNRNKHIPRKPPLRVMKKFLDEHPLELYRNPPRQPAHITARSISTSKGILGIVFNTVKGIKQILKISCANCHKRGCFQPVVEIMEPEITTQPKKKTSTAA